MEDLLSRLNSLIDRHCNGRYTVFAKEIGVPHPTIKNYLNGRMPSSDTLLKIHHKYNVSIDWLLTGKGDLCNKEDIAKDVNTETDNVSFGRNKKASETKDTLLNKAEFILDSDTIYGPALAENIVAFYEATQNEISSTNSDIVKLENRLKSVESELIKMKELAQKKIGTG